MALPTNDDFSNRELSAEELEAIAAGWPQFISNFMHRHPLAAAIIGGIALPAVGVGYALLVTM
jgi:hypothetical protein